MNVPRGYRNRKSAPRSVQASTHRSPMRPSVSKKVWRNGGEYSTKGVTPRSFRSLRFFCNGLKRFAVMFSEAARFYMTATRRRWPDPTVLGLLCLDPPIFKSGLSLWRHRDHTTCRYSLPVRYLHRAVAAVNPRHIFPAQTETLLGPHSAFHQHRSNRSQWLRDGSEILRLRWE